MGKEEKSVRRVNNPNFILYHKIAGLAIILGNLAWTHSAYYKKSKTEKGSPRELEERFSLKFIFAIPKSL